MSGNGITAASAASGGESFIVFAIDPSFEEIDVADVTGNEYKPLNGKYEGTYERSYICNAKHYQHLMETDLLDGQETVLVLGPAGTYGVRPATIHYLHCEQLPESLGYFKEVKEETALAQKSWTFDLEAKKYFVCQHNISVKG